MWYTDGVGGFNPNIPDFYQHQNWIFNGPSTGWEQGKDRGGWCYPTAYADVFYDLTKLGYTKLLSPSITDPAKWFDTAYNPANVANSDISKVAGALLGHDPQDYLDANGHKATDPTAPLLSNFFKVKADGTVTGTTESVFNFVNEKVKAGDDFLLNLLKGTTNPWWASSFHWLAGAGLDVKNSTVFVADPDSNKGSAAANAGWPNAATFPGALKSQAGDPIPIPPPNTPKIGTPASYNTYYAGLTLDDKNKVTGDAADARYTGTVVNYVSTISAPKGKLASVTPVSGQGIETAVAVISGASAVDKVFIAPTSQVVNFNDLFSFTLAGTTWSTTLKSQDPFQNSLSFGGVEYDLTSLGSGLTPGETALATLGTMSDFSTSGYEIFLHFTGDPSTLWDPEVIGPGARGPADIETIQPSPVPEPPTFVLAVTGAALGLGAWWRRQKRALAVAG
jgi:hypothetical protein